MSRNYKISTNSREYVTSERVNWIDQFADKINEAAQRTAVEVSRYRSQLSVHDQISSIVSNKPVNSSFKTVDGVVKEMQERAGLNEYLKLISSKDSFEATQNKQAQSEPLFGNISDSTRESILNFIKNKISTHRGQITVPALQYDILLTFKQSGLLPEDVNNDKVAKYISDQIVQTQVTNPTSISDNNIGKGVGVIDVDSSDNDDFMKGLMPNVGY